MGLVRVEREMSVEAVIFFCCTSWLLGLVTGMISGLSFSMERVEKLGSPKEFVSGWSGIRGSFGWLVPSSSLID